MRAVRQKWSQWGLDSALRKLFPLEWPQGFHLPVLDDLVNQSPFLDYGNFLKELGLDADAPGGPVIVSGMSRGWRRACENDQKGAAFSRDPVGQMVSLGLSSDEHWKEAQLLATKNIFPMDNGVVWCATKISDVQPNLWP